MRIEFFVEAPRPDTGPIGQPRQRHSRTGRNYIPDDHAIHAWKQAIRIKAIQNRPTTPIDGVPVKLTLTFYFPWPKPKSKSATAAYLKKHPNYETIPFLDKPDFDNLEKAVCDVLTDTGVYTDDKLVTHCVTQKRCTKTPKVGVQVVIECELPEPEQEPIYHMGNP